MQISLTEVQNDLVFSAAAYGIIGRPGVVLINCIIFMAVTSSGSGEMLAVSSLFTFDFYREYLRPQVSVFRTMQTIGVLIRHSACQVLIVIPCPWPPLPKAAAVACEFGFGQHSCIRL